MKRVEGGWAVPAAILASLVVAGLRVGKVTHPAYQAAAHVWVGMLLALWIAGGYGPESAGGAVFKWLFWALCAVEVVMAVVSRV